MILDGKRVLVTGGTGSFGQVVVKRLLSGELGKPSDITVFSRDEAKQHYMRLSYLNRAAATDEVIYRNFEQLLRFRIGDIRDFGSVLEALRNADVVIHAAALKQVPTCEYFPEQAVQTNILGSQNLVRAIRTFDVPVKSVVALSTDKACKPINVMGMTKAVMERVITEGNLGTDARLVCVRYGNVIASRGSVVPLFLDQIESGGPVTVTDPIMTRFLMSLDQAVDTVFAALQYAQAGEIFVPQVAAARILDVAHALIGDRNIEVKLVGVRPGEKIHETLISEEESFRTTRRNGYYVVLPMLPEIRKSELEERILHGEYSSSDLTLDQDGVRTLLEDYQQKYAFQERP